MNRHIRFLTFIGLLLIALTRYSLAQQPIKQLGNFISLNKIPHGATLQTANATINLIAYSATIIRVRIMRNTGNFDHSYAVIRQPGGQFSAMNSTDKDITLSTDSLLVRISKKPVRINFYRKIGNRLLSGDDETLGVVWDGSDVTGFRKLFKDEKIVGLGQKTGDINHIGQVLVDDNTDAAGFEPGTDPLYSSMPFYMCIHDSLVSGLFFDNTYKATFNFNLAGSGDTYSIGATGGEMNYYFFGASSMEDIIKDYTDLTGRMTMPPLWGLGYIQSRYSYMSQNAVLNVAKKFRQTNIPCDAIFCDIDYMDHFKVFTWKRDSFPNPKEMVDSLKALGFHLYVILDPALKIEKGYKMYDEGVSGNHFARYPDGKLFTGSVWAGPSYLTDFINDDTRKWWEKNITVYTNDGITGFLNDMDEPSFLLKTVPNAVLFGNKSNPVNFKEIHNVFGMEMARSTYEGVRAHTGVRPFNISRSAYAGIQRYAAMWTGDNQANDRHMMMDIRMCLSMNLTGLSYVGMNVGGFIGNPTGELMERWMQIGAYMPLFINHYEKSFKPHEPFAFDKPIQDELRKAIRYRYALLPYLYSAFYQASEDGIPILKALPYNYTFDNRVYERQYQHEFICGNDILVAPVLSTTDSATIYLPKGRWYRLSSNQAFQGDQELKVSSPVNDLPVFVRAGAIIPMQMPIEHTSQPSDGILRLNIWYGDNKNSFTYYEDDGNTFKYQNGDFYKRNIQWNPTTQTIQISKKDGSFHSRFNKIKLIFHKFTDVKNNIKVNGIKIPLIENNHNEEAIINNSDGAISIKI